MKYYILSREANPMVIMGRHQYTFLCELDTKEQLEALLNDKWNSNLEFKVIKGEELPWNEEYEEVTTVARYLKSRKLVYDKA